MKYLSKSDPRYGGSLRTDWRLVSENQISHYEPKIFESIEQKESFLLYFESFSGFNFFRFPDVLLLISGKDKNIV